MLNETEKEAIKKGMMTLWLVWGAMIGSLLIYLVVGRVVRDEVKLPMSPDFPLDLFRNILYLVSVTTILSAHFLRKLMLAVKDGGSSAGLVSYGAQSNQPLFVAKYAVAVIVSLALSETCAIYGLVLLFLGADFQTFYIFTALSALSMFFYRPRRAELEELTSAMQTKSASEGMQGTPLKF